jgi:hypothetical protein
MPLAPAPQTMLDQIESNLRDASRVEDAVVRKILTAILERQAIYFRHLVTRGYAPYASKDDLPSESSRPNT